MRYLVAAVIAVCVLVAVYLTHSRTVAIVGLAIAGGLLLASVYINWSKGDPQ